MAGKSSQSAAGRGRGKPQLDSGTVKRAHSVYLSGGDYGQLVDFAAHWGMTLSQCLTALAHYTLDGSRLHELRSCLETFEEFPNDASGSKYAEIRTKSLKRSNDRSNQWSEQRYRETPCIVVVAQQASRRPEFLDVLPKESVLCMDMPGTKLCAWAISGYEAIAKIFDKAMKPIVNFSGEYLIFATAKAFQSWAKKWAKRGSLVSGYGEIRGWDEARAVLTRLKRKEAEKRRPLGDFQLDEQHQGEPARGSSIDD